MADKETLARIGALLTKTFGSNEGGESIGNFLDQMDSAPFRLAMAGIEASKFIGEDGKEYFRFPARKPIANL